MQFDEEGNIIIPTDQPMVHTISCDEKPGIQAIATTSEDLRPKDGNSCVYRITNINVLVPYLSLQGLIFNGSCSSGGK